MSKGKKYSQSLIMDVYFQVYYSRLDSDHSVSMQGLFWGVGAALRPLPRPRPRCCCWLAGV